MPQGLICPVGISSKYPHCYRVRRVTYCVCSERSPELPSGFLNWFGAFFRISDAHVLNHSSIDGYLFLRFLRVMSSTCFTGCLITWPVLFPINAAGGGGNAQLDMLSFSNVKNPTWYYAHVIMACILFSRSRLSHTVAVC